MPTIFLYQTEDFITPDPCVPGVNATDGIPVVLTSSPAPKRVAVEVKDGDIATDDPEEAQKLTNRLVLGEVSFHAGASVSTNYTLTDSAGHELYAVTIGDAGDARTAAFASLTPLEPNTDFFYAPVSAESPAPQEHTELVCFTAGTLIETANGERPVETLSVGDRVQTHDNGLQPVRWIGQRTLHLDPFAFSQRLRPVCIPANAFGPGVPSHDLYLSPQHRVLLGDAEVLAPALALVGDLAWQPAQSSVTYHHLLFDSHEIIRSNSLWTESYYPGDHARQSLSDQEAQQLCEVLPDLRDQSAQMFYRSARPFASFAQSRALMRQVQDGWDIDPDYQAGATFM